MERNYIIESLFIVLGLALIATAIKYPKDIFIKLPVEIIKLPFRFFFQFLTLPVLIFLDAIVYFSLKYKWGVTTSLKKLKNRLYRFFNNF